MQEQTHRRRFIQTAAATSAGVWTSPSHAKSPNGRINIACIGVGVGK